MLTSVDWAEAGKALLMILGGASIIAKITPWEADNKFIDKILALINKLGLTKYDKEKK